MKIIKIILAVTIVNYLFLYSYDIKAQAITAEKENTCLFGFISDNAEEYSQVIDYLKVIGIKVISNCEEEYLIYVKLNNKYKDYTDLFAQIENRFLGTCYYKSQENKIPRYNKCREQLIKQNLKN